MTAAVMIDRCEKSHRAENLSSCSYSAFCAYAAAAAAAAAMMFRNRWTRRSDRFGVEAAKTTARKPAAMVGGCVFAS